MPDINKNISQLKPSATLLINEKVKELRSKGEVVYHFGFGQSPFPIPKKIVKELKKNADCNHYLPTQGLPSLRKTISEFLIKYQGIQTTGDHIFIGPGSKELLYQTILILNGTYLIPMGSWVSYLPQIKANNKNSKILETFRKDNYKLSPDVLESYCNDHPSQNKLLILNSPGNPSGAVYTDTELEKLACICRKFDVLVLSDEIYSQISFKREYASSISKYYPENTIIYGGLSKVFSAGGYRLGYMVLPQNLKELNHIYSSLFSETFSAVSAPVQYAAIEAYKYNKDIRNTLDTSVRILKSIGNYVYTELTKAEINCTQPEGGFYVLIGFENFQNELEKKELSNSIDLANHILTKYGVALLPGIDFYFDSKDLIFRLAYVDFNGKKALNAVLKKKKKIDVDFIEDHAPNVVEGIKRIIEFVKTLK